MKIAYLELAVLGAIIPLIFFQMFMVQYGVNLGEFIRQLFATLPASGFTADLLITSLVFWIWSFRESRVHGMRNWWAFVLLNLMIGLSCALPAFLLYRQIRLEQQASGCAKNPLAATETTIVPVRQV